MAEREVSVRNSNGAPWQRPAPLHDIERLFFTAAAPKDRENDVAIVVDLPHRREPYIQMR
jgi:hypothetical protein